MSQPPGNASGPTGTIKPHPGHLLCDGCHLADLPVVGLMREVEAATAPGARLSLTIHRNAPSAARDLRMNLTERKADYGQKQHDPGAGRYARHRHCADGAGDTEGSPVPALSIIHMALLFMLSGWFSSPHGRKRPSAARFAKRKVVRCGLPAVAANTVTFFTLLTTCF